MFCKNCGIENSDSAKFCKDCGSSISIIKKANSEIQQAETCLICKSHAPVAKVQFHRNVGAIVIRFHKVVDGKLCKQCLGGTFWEFTLVTLAVGWLAPLSIILAPFYIINNIYWYVLALNSFEE